MSSTSLSSGRKINTFCRIRPANGNTSLQYKILPSYDEKKNAESIELEKPIGHSKSAKKQRSQKYTFDKIFNENDTQVDVFEIVGRPVVDSVLNGYNGTVFAYGQTATGKTYTIIGEELEYENDNEWGMIPRTLDYIFKHLISKEKPFEVKVTFLEIYKEKMYDLLNVHTYERNKVTYTTKEEVSCRMDDDEVRLNNLALEEVKSSDEALDVFIEGNVNRTVADTYANQTSSRSHCVFTIYIKTEDDTGTLQSKLHLVDLAGSERVSKSHLGNQVLISEAKEINKSLLFLHKVIEAIGKNQKPETFRNTTITKILRDSLIGNSMTSLIATISIEEENIDETLSTCNFADSVSKIKTKPVLNKQEDLNIIITRLQEENQRLNQRIKQLERADNEELTNDDIDNLRQLVLEYYNDDDPDIALNVSHLNVKVQFCFNELKTLGKANVKGTDSEIQIKQPEEDKTEQDITEEQMRSLDRRIDEFLSVRNDNAAELVYATTFQAQYCFKRLKYIVSEFDDNKNTKNKGCC